MAFKEVMWAIHFASTSTKSLDAMLQRDKEDKLGVECGLFGNMYYIPADAKIGGL